MAALLTRGVGGARYEASGLAELAPRRLLPWRRLLALLLVLLLLLGLLGYCHEVRGPDSLAHGKLVGPRSPVPVHLVVLLDESGSFSDYQGLRRKVLDEVVTWAPENLRPDDTLSVIGFSGDAGTRIATTSIGDLSAQGPTYLTSAPTDGTRIEPALRRAVAEAPGGAGPTSLIVLTDTLVEDADRTTDDDLVRRLGVTTMSVIVPSGLDLSRPWAQAFPYERVFEAGVDSENETALALGRAVAHATGQKLESTN